MEWSEVTVNIFLFFSLSYFCQSVIISLVSHSFTFLELIFLFFLLFVLSHHVMVASRLYSLTDPILYHVADLNRYMTLYIE